MRNRPLPQPKLLGTIPVHEIFQELDRQDGRQRLQRLQMDLHQDQELLLRDFQFLRAKRILHERQEPEIKIPGSQDGDERSGDLAAGVAVPAAEGGGPEGPVSINIRLLPTADMS